MLADGAAELLSLKVPFRGKLEQPEQNYRGNSEGVHAFGPYGLGLTWLELQEDQLFLQVATEQASWGLAFDLAQARGR